jgi:hypothetical protein
MAVKKVKKVTIEEVETPKETTPEIVEEKVKEWSYDELVLLPREEFLKVQAQVRAGKAKFKPQ